jgi:hypothetical protein
MSKAEFELRGLEQGGRYKFTDADSGEETVMAYSDIKNNGLEVKKNEKRSSRLIRYRKVN